MSWEAEGPSNGDTDQILEWMSDFSLERYQRVVLKGESSNWTKVSSAVPQGSIVGPILLLLYNCNCNWT